VLFAGWCALWLTLSAGVAAASDIDFNRDIRPILSNNCFRCHGPDEAKREAELRLDTFEGATAQLPEGRAIQPGQVASSLMLARIESHDPSERMPPPESELTLSTQQIELLKQWIAEGARYEAHWAFQPLKLSAPPQLSRAEWTHNAIDAYILAALDERRLTPSPPAARGVLQRRLYLDLLGLPPTAAEVQALADDARPDAMERVIDRLLASPRYGERWGRHWLDQARYADTNGYTVDTDRSIWPYRDWVIRAINDDLPFDQFSIEQLAGDLLEQPTQSQLIATGFHRNTLVNQEGGTDPEQFRNEAVVDRVNTTGAVWLGLTVGCAQCHHHKYDPFSQREFYALFAFFNSDADVNSIAPTLTLASAAEATALDEVQAHIGLVTNALGDLKTLEPAPAEQVAWLEGELKILEQRSKELQAKTLSSMVMRQQPQPRESFIHIRGDFLRHGEPVQPDVPASVPPALAASKSPGTRLDLARWLVSPENPLVARVVANRSWSHFFPFGLVETENDFGIQGTPATHPALLDWLALELRDGGWSMKGLHRQIVRSATYQQSSEGREDLQTVDPINKLLARQSRLRVEAEIVRDCGLQASGLLDNRLGGASVYPPQPDGVYAFTQNKGAWPTSMAGERFRRGMYTFFRRSAPYPMLTTFDTPRFDTTCTRRTRSNTPLQSLTLANDVAALEMATALGRRLWEHTGDDSARMQLAFESCLARRPTAAEAQSMLDYWSRQKDELRSEPAAADALLANLTQQPGWPSMKTADADQNGQRAAWIMVARVIMNLDEFVTRE
jgi:hypothetical protein